jgi:tRNA threonylcarbamoyladenosine biosynthesis protein TsaB
MKLLALDTATEACSCALLYNVAQFERSVMTTRHHAELILPMIDEMMQQANLRPQQLDAVVMGCGPGSFTGLRIACGVAQGIAFAAEVPIIPISSLAALAQAAYRDKGVTHVLAAIDARMGEVYWGEYILGENKLMQLCGEECVCPPYSVKLLENSAAYGVGSGWMTYSTALLIALGTVTTISVETETTYPQAAAMLPLAVAAFEQGLAVSPELALPIYLRNKVVHGS